MRSLLAALCLALPVAAPPKPQDSAEPGAARRALDRESPHAALEWRALGPRYCGGRIESIAVTPGDSPVWYVAPGSGNLFRSDDQGRHWKPLFEHEATGAIGDVTLDPQDPDTVWVGTGEAHLGGVSFDGTGVYRSQDGGRSFEHRGLAAVARIGKVRVDPRDSNVLLVAAIGPLGGGASEHRGVFRTQDAGASWTRTLDAGPTTAAIDLVVDPADPDRVFVATWDRGGGTGSGVYRSTDDGRSFVRLGLEGDLLRGPTLERIAVDLCRDQPDELAVLVVDSAKPGEGRYGVGGVLFRSHDGGETFEKMHEDYLPTYVGWDFCDVKVDPRDPERIYVCGSKLLVSADGGRHFDLAGERVRRRLPYRATGIDPDAVLHLDMHDLWIDPAESAHLLLGCDGGLFESRDHGRSWLHHNTLPIAEFYTVHAEAPHEAKATAEAKDPEGADVSGENVGSGKDDGVGARPILYGGIQDNAAVLGPLVPLAEQPADEDVFRPVFVDQWLGGDGFVTLPDPGDPDIVYFEHQNGDLRRKDLRGVTLSGAADVRIRPRGRDLSFAWNTPFLVSAHEPGRVYCAAQHVFRSADRGDHWERIGEELGGGNALVTLEESPLDGLRLAAGDGGGRIAVTQDGGATWTKAELPTRRLRRLRWSVHEAQRLYAAAKIVLRSDDSGLTWQSLDAGFPPEEVTCVLEDARSSLVLYAATLAGVCVSEDGGESWSSLSTTLPTVPVLDLDLVPGSATLLAATHGRGLFALDVSSIEPDTVR